MAVEDLRSCRQSVEDRLVEDYRASRSSAATRAELERIAQGKHRTAPCAAAAARTITYNSSFCQQFYWVLKRTFRNLMLNPQTSVAQVRPWDPPPPSLRSEWV